MYAGRSDGGVDGGVAGALLDDGACRTPDDTVPGDLPPDFPPDLEPGTGPDAGPDWPPSVVPVVLWPVETLQQALTGAPGAQLARVVAEAMDRPTDLDPDLLAGLPDDALGDLATACGRLQSWAAGLQARVVAERAARESHALAHASLVAQVTGELVVTETEAGEVVVRAESGAQHPTVITALIAGRIDVRKAHTLLRSAAQLTTTERAEAIDRYLPQAPHRTWKWLQTRMLAFAKTRHSAAQNARAEAERRCVQLDRAENDMGWLTAYLAATDAAAVWGVIDDMAHQLRHVSGEDRTLGQLRADSLTAIITGRLLPAGRFADGTDPADKVDTEVEPEVHSTESTDSGDTRVCTCGGRAPVVHETVQVVRITPTRPVVRVTVPASTLLGLDDAPGDLTGYGPIPADTARQIANDATWQRLLTDPVTGILTDYSTTTYQPGKVLRGAIETRDGTCTFLWGCDTPATRCDLDHIQPFDHEHRNERNDGGQNGDRGSERGQTRAQNLHALCRKHHLLKTHAGWDVVRDPITGITTWTAPNGHVHTRPPTVLDTHIDLDQIDPDTSHDLTLHALTGQRLPRSYQTTEPGAIPTEAVPTDPTAPTDPDEPPF
ncbi:HNH endonuclease [Promicromonospora vindobonensis]|uniref:HNH endonuclease n=1 Tax=Promicromonospora vindobonensis TaxID=195748 RepID=A0ABW5VUU3_9MICO